MEPRGSCGHCRPAGGLAVRCLLHTVGPLRLLQWEAEASDPLLSWVEVGGKLTVPGWTRVWGQGKTDFIQYYADLGGHLLVCLGVLLFPLFVSHHQLGFE